MGCYQSDVYVPQFDELGTVIDYQVLFTGCHQDYVDTVSEALSLLGGMDVSKSACVTTQYEQSGTFRYYCVDQQIGPFESYAFFLPDGVPVQYAGPHVASIAGGSNQDGSLPNYPQAKGTDMLCVTTGEGGALVIQNPQPANLSECGMVVLSGSEAMGNPFALSTEEGAVIGTAIVAVWAVGFGIRAVIQTLKGSSNEEVSA